MSRIKSSSRYQTAMVTGASSGIGRAVTRRLVGEGLRVHAVDRDAEALRNLARECDVETIVIDLQDTSGLADLFKNEEIDIVVNNAGTLPGTGTFGERPETDIDLLLDINLRAPLHISHMALQGMVERKRGHLFFLGSSAGRYPHPNCAGYSAAKAGISMFCDALRCDLLGSAVRVTEIAPGRVQTHFYRTALGDATAKEKLYDGYRPIQPEHIAELIGRAMTMPDYVDVSRIEVFPTDQAAGGSHIVRYEE
ncbi:SDR family oxidoreductase [Paraburkholderia terrae]|uniref:SDR family NAD(P)-dependent oxidoreductase n=1 Tax=Paraburkholderia terrae TaxID=311230 RepID=A0A2I8ET19_9BURK|nr:SDR family oxidoreductase [Paraburkholderia terrae]AUT62783.1 SDR family NAD(P)-dependent oxidoreductase [Paraburkholderia terrae]